MSVGEEVERREVVRTTLDKGTRLGLEKRLVPALEDSNRTRVEILTNHGSNESSDEAVIDEEEEEKSQS